jgi:hypothetical protein
MPTNYIFSVSSVKYGTATGSNTMPASGAMTTLPDTVKGSINMEEAEGAIQKFYTDQKRDPIKIVKTEEGDLVATMQFYDLTYATIAALKGGTGDASGYVPSTAYTLIEKALQINTDSGHTFDFYNASIQTRIMGGGGRDAMFSMEMKATPQVTADLAGSWKVRPTT